jgi:hypothetical protein
MATSPLAVVNTLDNLLAVVNASGPVPGQVTAVPVSRLQLSQNPVPPVTLPVVVATVNGVALTLDATWSVLSKDGIFLSVANLSSKDLLAMGMVAQAGSLGVGLPASGNLAASALFEVGKRVLNLPYNSVLSAPGISAINLVIIQGTYVASSVPGEAPLGDGGLEPLWVTVVWFPLGP